MRVHNNCYFITECQNETVQKYELPKCDVSNLLIHSFPSEQNRFSPLAKYGESKTASTGTSRKKKLELSEDLTIAPLYSYQSRKTN